MIRFYCFNCGREITVSDELAGRRGACNRCGATNKIPGPRETAQGAQSAQRKKHSSTSRREAGAHPNARRATARQSATQAEASATGPGSPAANAPKSVSDGAWVWEATYIAARSAGRHSWTVLRFCGRWISIGWHAAAVKAREYVEKRRIAEAQARVEQAARQSSAKPTDASSTAPPTDVHASPAPSPTASAAPAQVHQPGLAPVTSAPAQVPQPRLAPAPPAAARVPQQQAQPTQPPAQTYAAAPAATSRQAEWPSPAPDAEVGRTILCPSCRRRNAASNFRCTYCGKQIEEQQPSRVVLGETKPLERFLPSVGWMLRGLGDAPMACPILLLAALVVVVIDVASGITILGPLLVGPAMWGGFWAVLLAVAARRQGKFWRVFEGFSAFGPVVALSLIWAVLSVLLAGGSFALTYWGLSTNMSAFVYAGLLLPLYFACRLVFAVPLAVDKGLSVGLALRGSWGMTSGRTAGIGFTLFCIAQGIFLCLLAACIICIFGLAGMALDKAGLFNGPVILGSAILGALVFFMLMTTPLLSLAHSYQDLLPTVGLESDASESARSAGGGLFILIILLAGAAVGGYLTVSSGSEKGLFDFADSARVKPESGLEDLANWFRDLRGGKSGGQPGSGHGAGGRLPSGGVRSKRAEELEKERQEAARLERQRKIQEARTHWEGIKSQLRDYDARNSRAVEYIRLKGVISLNEPYAHKPDIAHRLEKAKQDLAALGKVSEEETAEYRQGREEIVRKERAAWARLRELGG